MATDDQARLFVEWTKSRLDGMQPFCRDLEDMFQEYRAARTKDARTSPGPTNCNVRKTFQGVVRGSDWCDRCGQVGDQKCPFFNPDGSAR